MKIPEKVKVGGVTYAVKMTDGVDDVTSGIINMRAQEIRILDAMSRDSKSVTLLHEILHAIYQSLGHYQSPEDGEHERHIDQLAYALYALIVDNPEMFEINPTM